VLRDRLLHLRARGTGAGEPVQLRHRQLRAGREETVLRRRDGGFAGRISGPGRKGKHHHAVCPD
ncbi:unnamed protein product, partial [Amoebophrya sp. A120]